MDMKSEKMSDFIYYDQNSIERYGKGTSKKALRIKARRLRMFKQQKELCHWCKNKMQLTYMNVTPHGNIKYNNLFATFEHVIPKAKGGQRTEENTVLAHATCNRNRHRRKWDHDPVYGKLKTKDAAKS